MQIGWIDFSRSERNKILSVLDSLGEKGTLDELGISPIRDGFADLFFPGTSTLHTKAKYFLIVPYACREVELSDIFARDRVVNTLDEIEKDCAKRLCNVHSRDRQGIIGNDAITRNSWVKRAPSTLYWAGLRRYGIFTQERLSLSGYIKVMCAQKSRKVHAKSMGKLGNRNDNDDIDDIDAGDASLYHYFDVPSDFDNKTWKDNLSLRLTRSEAAFLKSKITENVKGSLLASVLDRNLKEFSACNSFEEIAELIPLELRTEYELALDFSKFLYALRVVYNEIVSDGQNEFAKTELAQISSDFGSWSDVDIEAIFMRLKLFNKPLKDFLISSQTAMRAHDLEALKKHIRQRERSIKGESRAKTYHAGQFDSQAWFGGGYLDYRFGNAKTLISDIFEGEESNV